jgi:hypothetical protein
MRDIFCDWEGVCEGLGDTLASIPGLSIADVVAYCHHPLFWVISYSNFKGCDKRVFGTACQRLPQDKIPQCLYRPNAASSLINQLIDKPTSIHTHNQSFLAKANLVWSVIVFCIPHNMLVVINPQANTHTAQPTNHSQH